jgi:hypothetical protein
MDPVLGENMRLERIILSVLTRRNIDVTFAPARSSRGNIKWFTYDGAGSEAEI